MRNLVRILVRTGGLESFVYFCRGRPVFFGGFRGPPLWTPCIAFEAVYRGGPVNDSNTAVESIINWAG